VQIARHYIRQGARWDDNPAADLGYNRGAASQRRGRSLFESGTRLDHQQRSRREFVEYLRTNAELAAGGAQNRALYQPRPQSTRPAQRLAGGDPVGFDGPARCCWASAGAFRRGELAALDVGHLALSIRVLLDKGVVRRPQNANRMRPCGWGASALSTAAGLAC
jgi:hypothetical protein